LGEARGLRGLVRSPGVAAARPGRARGLTSGGSAVPPCRVVMTRRRLAVARHADRTRRACTWCTCCCEREMGSWRVVKGWSAKTAWCEGGVACCCLSVSQSNLAKNRCDEMNVHSLGVPQLTIFSYKASVRRADITLHTTTSESHTCPGKSKTFTRHVCVRDRMNTSQIPVLYDDSTVATPSSAWGASQSAPP
jgi:hypothetical protein